MHAALILAAVSETTDARHLREIGLLVGGLAAVALLVGGILGYMSVRPAKAAAAPKPVDPGDPVAAATAADAKPAAAPKSRTAEERIAYIAAGFLLGVSFLIQIIAARTA